MNEWVSEWLLQYSYPHKAPQFSLLSQQLMVSSTMKASALYDILRSKQTLPHPSSYSLNVPSMSLGPLELEKIIFSPLFRLHNVACGLRIVVYLTRDWTHAPCAGSVEFNHWTTRETWLLFEDTAFHTFQENSGHCPLSEGNLACMVYKPKASVSVFQFLLSLCCRMVFCIPEVVYWHYKGWL